MKNILQNKNAFTKNINSKNNNNGSVKKVRIDIKIISMTFVSFSWFINYLFGSKFFLYLVMNEKSQAIQTHNSTLELLF